MRAYVVMKNVDLQYLSTCMSISYMFSLFLNDPYIPTGHGTTQDNGLNQVRAQLTRWARQGRKNFQVRRDWATHSWPELGFIRL